MKVMSDSHLILLLQVIHAQADTNALLRRGLSYSQIAHLISESINLGYVVLDNHSLKLTMSGEYKMKTDLKEGKLRADGGWISPLEEFQMERWSLDDIYLPSEDDSHF